MKHRATARGSLILGVTLVVAALITACTPSNGGATTPPGGSPAPAGSAAPAASAPASNEGSKGNY